MTQARYDSFRLDSATNINPLDDSRRRRPIHPLPFHALPFPDPPFPRKLEWVNVDEKAKTKTAKRFKSAADGGVNGILSPGLSTTPASLDTAAIDLRSDHTTAVIKEKEVPRRRKKKAHNVEDHQYAFVW